MSNFKEPNGTGYPSSAPRRFDRRWCFIGAGLSNVWRFGDLELPAPSGRLLLRGPNGTGKTTALEALIPYLLDLNAGRLSAGRARTTSFASLMRESAGKRRVGYAWLSFSDSASEIWSFGVRISYSESASPPVKINPFTVRGRPLRELQLYLNDHGSLSLDDFQERVNSCSGEVFADEEAYLSHLSARLFFSSDRDYLKGLLETLRSVRNPSLLGDISPQHAADALKAALPTVDDDVILATADALAESKTTRIAFERDQEAADELLKFREVWRAHATEVVTQIHRTAADASEELRKQKKSLSKIELELDGAKQESTTAATRERELSDAATQADTDIRALEKTDAYQAAPRLEDLRNAAQSKEQAAESALKTIKSVARSAAEEAATSLARFHDAMADLSQFCRDARSADELAEDGQALLSVDIRKRPDLQVGSNNISAGQELMFHGTSDQLISLSHAWLSRAAKHATRANAANLALIDHKPVKALDDQRSLKDAELRKAQSDFAVAQKKTSDALEQCKVEIGNLIETLLTWNTRSRSDAHELVACHSARIGTLNELFWDDEEIRNLRREETSNVLAESESWSRLVLEETQTVDFGCRSAAAREREQSEKLTEDARQKRETANGLRSGKLIPFPRPDWAGTGDDDIALGAAIEWRPEFGGKREQALLESALAASGVLSAVLTGDGAETRRWRVDAAAPVCVPSLADVLCVDSEHALAGPAAAVLSRIQLIDSAATVEEAPLKAGLMFGRDGTFRAGVLSGRVPGAEDASLLSDASYIGARQRLAAARAQADKLDREAGELEQLASECEQRARELVNVAQKAIQIARSFPTSKNLNAAEIRRAALDQEEKLAQQRVGKIRTEYETAKGNFENAHREWSARTSACDLPPNPEQLARLSLECDRVARELKRAADPLKAKLPDRLRQILISYNPEAAGKRLSDAHAEAQQLHDESVRARREVEVLESTTGAAIKEVLAQSAS